ncbi:hypothetical protein C5167_003493 [Papaver somniferum]|uniref:MENTAL domain-containing protein n=1 Tax=Papaver somniferum TaxID=3469 RepID=A0A4Y7L3S3_PAPSO|nr:uncharacterized protein LOC113309233 [Papaver somniferum]RZC79280.1 hypothetical protein C5167_003493 [Papaver somniferum]
MGIEKLITIKMITGILNKDDQKFNRGLRAIKTLFFFISMLISLLLFSAPVLLVLTDAILPCAILSLSLPSSQLNSSLQNFSYTDYDFRFSLVDIPLLSIVRSFIILCVYCLCDGPGLTRGPYLAITTFSSVSSLAFVSLKASYVFCVPFVNGGGGGGGDGHYIRAALITSSIVLAIGHIVVAYRTSCRERRKLLLYKIDIEAVSSCKKGFPTYNKILQQVRVK